MLEDLYAGAAEDSERRRSTVSTSHLESIIACRAPAIDALNALKPRERIQVLAEIKRSSPSKGSLATIEDAPALARIYEQHGASAISVLTEERKFKGSLADLEQVRAAVNVPLLRKDFISNEYQLLEARAHGADIFLLIVAGLDVATLARLKAFGEELGMTAFVETHSGEELKVAGDVGAKLIGVNARDLTTFETDRDLFSKLVGDFPDGAIKVAESAVREVSDVVAYRQAGADVVLIGEALVTGDPASRLDEFLNS
ncbi:MAG: indole-3-glycerol-phosphate synthase TrpC [Actinobacteria bacterium]|uniref:indole-3-glycerol-phosphate synthase n=1 Tax=freshwater metagenome TaxID=449393 RepID=A0A6J6HJ50_9ZZZZ|nr:indole-3-glycerol-phosphate synthase TrpC [Actinomycetota bacterium]